MLGSLSDAGRRRAAQFAERPELGQRHDHWPALVGAQSPVLGADEVDLRVAARARAGSARGQLFWAPCTAGGGLLSISDEVAHGYSFDLGEEVGRYRIGVRARSFHRWRRCRWHPGHPPGQRRRSPQGRRRRSLCRCCAHRCRGTTRRGKARFACPATRGPSTPEPEGQLARRGAALPGRGGTLPPRVELVVRTGHQHLLSPRLHPSQRLQRLARFWRRTGIRFGPMLGISQRHQFVLRSIGRSGSRQKLAQLLIGDTSA